MDKFKLVSKLKPTSDPSFAKATEGRQPEAIEKLVIGMKKDDQ